MKPQNVSFKVESFRRIETPLDKKFNFRNYVIIIDVNELPDLSGWRKINVRDPKLTTSLAREIKDSFLNNQDTFLFLNRGIVLAVEKASFDNSKGIATITFANVNLHGLLDGGHTYEIITRNRELLDRGEKQYIKLEIIEGFDQEELVKLVDARNSSNQVKDESLMNLANEFSRIQNAIKKEPYASEIAFSEFQLNEDGEPCPISIREILSYLMTMDLKNFTRSLHPINSYRSKSACLKHFSDHMSDFEPLYPLTKDILELWDNIHLKLPELYNKVRSDRGGVSGGKFGRLTGVSVLNTANQPLYFIGSSSNYIIPSGFKYPILGAFRALIDQKRNGSYAWHDNVKPSELLDKELGEDLAQTIGEFALDAQNPSKTGKSQLVWQSCYQCAELFKLRM